MQQDPFSQPICWAIPKPHETIAQWNRQSHKIVSLTVRDYPFKVNFESLQALNLYSFGCICT